MTYRLTLLALFATALFSAGTARAQSYLCEKDFALDDATTICYRFGPELPPPPPAPEPSKPSPTQLRLIKYAAIALKHQLSGLASYYSSSLDGTLTANGEIYRNKRLTAAHLTLPLGTWVEIKARATGRKIRLRVNDRGPYVSKFVVDLSQAAARALGVDVTPDRHVDIRIVALPGEDPLPESETEQFADAPSPGALASSAIATIR